MTNDKIDNEIVEQIRDGFKSALNQDVVITLRGYELTVLFSSYDKFSFTFDNLLAVARIFGTTKFSINDELEKGRVYSEYTADSDEIVKRFVVKIVDLNSGLPKGI